ncbi:MAG: SDR family oxidoreductase, partial [Bacteroidota bacterium]|nr:SDR family oxidoreductase [Bacteroidota bacterium]
MLFKTYSLLMAIAYQTPLRIILTGATGMVGEGVLHEALSHSGIQEVLVINRHPCGVSHPKLKEIIHQNFMDFSPIEDRLSGYDGCLFCLGVSSVGMKEDRYYSLTHELTLHVAGTLAPRNPHMTFCYISGAGTD